MNQLQERSHSTTETVPASPPAIQLSENLEARSIQTEHSAQFGGVGVTHVIQPPSEFKVTLTHHLLTVQIDTNWRNFRQVSRFAGQEYDNLFSPYGFILLPAKTPAFFSWNQTDESVIFTLEQTALQQIAIENDCLNPSRVELLPIIYQRDPKLEFFAKSFKEEMHNNALGGRLYSESLANLFTIHLLRHYCAFDQS